MKILHVLSQFEVTGAELYAVGLARRQAEMGHEILIVSDTLTARAPGRYLPFPIGKRSYPERFRAIRFLVRLIRREGVSVIHAHSRAASWVSFFASLLTRTPLVSTVHGRQHLHASVHLLNIYGRFVIAVNRTLKQHLINEVGIPPAWVTEIPNGLAIPEGAATLSPRSAVFGTAPSERVVLFVGRLTGPKGDVVRSLVRDVMPALARRMSVALAIVGGQIVPEDIPELVRSSNRSLGREAVVLYGFRQNLRPFFATADVVVGSGRVMIESMLEGTPAIAYGESGYLGKLTPGNVAVAAASNFGDTGCRNTPSLETVVEDIVAALRDGISTRDRLSLQEYIRSHYDVTMVERQVDSVYRRARASLQLTGSVPVLMYHRVVEAPPAGSRHGIWVTADRFDAQLRSLHRRGYTPITMRRYQEFLRGDADLPAKPVVLTFDDGYEDNYRVAFPLLQRYGYPAVVFLVTDFSRRTNFWDPDEPAAPLLQSSQIREMDAAGIEFGSHTVTHPHLSHLPRERLHEELHASKRRLEDLTGRSVQALAYPYGDLNDDVKDAMLQTGYDFGVATDSGPLAFGDDLLQIRRIPVFPGTDALGFWKKTHPWYLRYRNVMGK